MTYEFFKLVGDKNRLNILSFIRLEGRTVGEIVKALNMEQSLVSHHLQRLRNYGIVKSRVKGRSRVYSVSDPEILAIIEKTSRVMKAIAREPLGLAGEKRIETQFEKSPPKSMEEALKVIPDFEKEFVVLFGEKMATKIAGQMKRTIEKELN